LRPLDRLSDEVAALDGFAGQRLDAQHRYRVSTSALMARTMLENSR
jgi:two-component system, OmpR family, sensor histidine kinase QseC